MSSRVLQRALRFRNKDLQANKHGALSKRQVRKLSNERTNQTFAAYLFGGLFLLVAIVLWQQTLAGALFFIAAAVLVVYGEFRLSRIPLENLDVEQVTGTVEKIQLIDEADENEYIIRIGDLDFETSLRQYKAFKDGGQYTLYYVRFRAEDGIPLENPPLMLSAEDHRAQAQAGTQPQTA